MRRIGFVRKEYPEERCILSTNNTYVNINKFNLIKYIKKFRVPYFEKNNFVFKPISWMTKLKKLDGIHTFNDIVIDNIPWICSFETAIPRFHKIVDLHRKNNNLANFPIDPEIEKYLSILSSSQCKKLLPLSESAFFIQKDILKPYAKHYDSIINKMEVLHPPQPLLDVCRTYDFSGGVNFVFVGNDFIRKGGGELLQACLRLKEKGVINKSNFKLNIIADLSKTFNYVFPFDEKKIDYNQALKELEDLVSIYSGIPNEKVLSIIAKSDIGILPTWGETYGFSVLEMQASGCPVITTNVRALTEINSNVTGWIIDLPLNNYKEVDATENVEIQNVKNMMVDSIFEIINNIYVDKAMIKEKSIESQKRIRDVHDPVKYNMAIDAYYNEFF